MVGFSLDKAMGFHLSEVVAELVKGIGFWGEAELLGEALVKISGFP